MKIAYFHIFVQVQISEQTYLISLFWGNPDFLQKVLQHQLHESIQMKKMCLHISSDETIEVVCGIIYTAYLVKVANCNCRVNVISCLYGKKQ